MISIFVIYFRCLWLLDCFLSLFFSSFFTSLADRDKGLAFKQKFFICMIINLVINIMCYLINYKIVCAAIFRV